jgi:hypothetical protein
LPFGKPNAGTAVVCGFLRHYRLPSGVIASDRKADQVVRAGLPADSRKINQTKGKNRWFAGFPRHEYTVLPSALRWTTILFPRIALAVPSAE